MTRGVPRSGGQRYQSPRSREKKIPVLARLPEELVDQLDRFAQNACRSLSGEILLRLEYTLHVDHEVMLAARREKASETARGNQQ